MSRPFAARFATWCPECGHDVEPGQQVRYDDADVLVHADAADCDRDETTPLREQPVCPSCWTTHAGECM